MLIWGFETWLVKMCVFVCISHTCRNLNFTKNVTTLLHWADDMKCLINSVKNSSSKKKKIPTGLPYFCSARYANITIFFFWPNLSLKRHGIEVYTYAFWRHTPSSNPSLISQSICILYFLVEIKFLLRFSFLHCVTNKLTFLRLP